MDSGRCHTWPLREVRNPKPTPCGSSETRNPKPVPGVNSVKAKAVKTKVIQTTVGAAVQAADEEAAARGAVQGRGRGRAREATAIGGTGRQRRREHGLRATESTTERPAAQPRIEETTDQVRVHARPHPTHTQHTARTATTEANIRPATARSRAEAAHTHHEAAWGAPGPRGRPEIFLTSSGCSARLDCSEN